MNEEMKGREEMYRGMTWEASERHYKETCKTVGQMLRKYMHELFVCLCNFYFYSVLMLLVEGVLLNVHRVVY